MWNSKNVTHSWLCASKCAVSSVIISSLNVMAYLLLPAFKLHWKKKQILCCVIEWDIPFVIMNKLCLIRKTLRLYSALIFLHCTDYIMLFMLLLDLCNWCINMEAAFYCENQWRQSWLKWRSIHDEIIFYQLII